MAVVRGLDAASGADPTRVWAVVVVSVEATGDLRLLRALVIKQTQPVK